MTLPIHLVLFFTRGVSLQTWARNGSLEREIALYLRLQENGFLISFVTYGDVKDLEFAADLHGIEVLCNRWKLPQRWYEFFLPLLFPRQFFKADVFKTNQTNGADVALRIARIWRKPLVARCGYMWSDLATYSGKQIEAERARQIESMVFPAAKRVVVTTPSMKEYLTRHYNLLPQKVSVIPNYVLTELFSPDSSQPIKGRICFVGRLSMEKNLQALIRACAGLEDVELWLVGEGSMRSELQELAERLEVKVKMPGSIPHHELPELIRSAAIFALVSPHEGHPKSLLEAMSCGAAVLGADSPGIREQITHGETGWLVGTDAEKIRSGIQHMLLNPSLCKKLGANARRYIINNYSLDKISEKEFSLYQKIV